MNVVFEEIKETVNELEEIIKIINIEKDNIETKLASRRVNDIIILRDELNDIKYKIDSIYQILYNYDYDNPAINIKIKEIEKQNRIIQPLLPLLLRLQNLQNLQNLPN
jgi:hypothetical protein